MAPGYGSSFTVWCSPTPGTILWPFKFKDDYIDRAYVRVRYQDFDGKWYPVNLHPTKSFDSDFVLRIEPVIPPCHMVDIYRDTPKDGPIVIYGNGGALLADETRNAAARQSMHVVVELKELANRTDLDCLCGCVGG